MSISYSVAYLSWPLIAIGVVCCIVLRWRKVHGLPPSNFIGLVAAISLIVPFPLIFAFANATAANLFVEDITFILMGIALSLLVPFFKQASPARAAGLVGAGLMLLGAYDVSGDFIRDREQASGTVTRRYVTRGSRGFYKFYIEIDGRGFPITFDLYRRIDAASRVKVMMGRASGTIFAVTVLAAAPTVDRLSGTLRSDTTRF